MKEKETTQVKDTWEYKDRHYYLSNGREPLSYTIPSRHTRKYPLTWFDPEVGYERELRYATNQKSIFVDEQEGPATLKHIVFVDGVLHVPKEKRNLQEFLNKHPHRGYIFQELDKQVEAIDELQYLELQDDAVGIARTMDIEQIEAILRVEQGSGVSNLSSKELKRDGIIFAKKNPALFIELANDENVVLRNFAIKAREHGIIKLSDDQRTFTWATNGRKLMTVPFDENPYSAMAAWFKTDEGLEVYKSIDKKLK
jgi:hypothetical protein